MPGNEAVEAAHHADNQRRLSDVETAMTRIEVRFDERLEKMAFDMHALKGSLAANTSFTKEMLEQQSVNNRQVIQQIEANSLATQTLVTKTSDIVSLWESTGGTLRFARGVGGFVMWCGKLASAVLILVGVPAAIVQYLGIQIPGIPK
jgi:hypothetical protein